MLLVVNVKELYVFVMNCVSVCVCAKQCAHHFKLKISTRGKYARVKMNFIFIDTVSFIHDMHGLISGLHAIVSYLYSFGDTLMI